ncbi:hypothetical protein GLOIN_2v1866772 [Rhizophagus irregularis DAOM 181602=DAOM 197198]|nr:hypothetical protein GLOIN_2v1866772 [Rhizophagus irregularis DAOM 181602=DAOM 197198]
MVIKDNQEPVRLKLHIGDIVDLNEEFKGVAYAIKQTMKLEESLHVAPSMMRLIEVIEILSKIKSYMNLLEEILI